MRGNRRGATAARVRQAQARYFLLLRASSKARGIKSAGSGVGRMCCPVPSPSALHTFPHFPRLPTPVGGPHPGNACMRGAGDLSRSQSMPGRASAAAPIASSTPVDKCGWRQRSVEEAAHKCEGTYKYGGRQVCSYASAAADGCGQVMSKEIKCGS